MEKSTDTAVKPGFDSAEMIAQVKAWGENMIEQLSSVSTLYQIAAIAMAFILGWLLSRRPVKNLTEKSNGSEASEVLRRFYRTLSGALFPVIAVVLIWIAMLAFGAAGIPNRLLRIAAGLLNAAIIVRVITTNMNPGPWRTVLAWLAWSVAALYILRALKPVLSALDSAGMPLGDNRITLLQIITSVMVAGVALWVGRLAGETAQAQLQKNKRLTPSMSGLLGQVVKIGLMVIAVMFALNAIGINLAAFAVLSGAIGVGIGFGLQSIFSNFVSGIIILFEKSVQVGDFIQLQSGTTGQVKEINIRATLVTTNDDVDILVPNEEFIKAQVINWTLRDARRRLKVSFGVAYGADKEIVRKAGLEAAAAVNWTDNSKGREPEVWLVEFGDSSLNFELVVWLLAEAVKRPGSVVAAYNWAIHTALQKYDIEIPFPQRDLNIRQPAELTVTIAEPGKKKK